MPPIAPLPLSSLSSLHASFVSEQAILEQVVYRNRNQHRKANYFQHLLHVVRHNRHVDLLAVAHALLPPTPSSASPPFLLSTIDRLRSCVCAILRAADPLYALLQQTYFMPLALTSLALLARLLVVVKAALQLLMTEARDREAQSRQSNHFARHSVGQSLLSALKEAKGELVVAELDGYALDEQWQPNTATQSRIPLPSTRSSAQFASTSLDQKQLQDIPFLDDASTGAGLSSISVSPRPTPLAVSPRPPDRPSLPAQPSPSIPDRAMPRVHPSQAHAVAAESEDEGATDTAEDDGVSLTDTTSASLATSPFSRLQQSAQGEAANARESDRPTTTKRQRDQTMAEQLSPPVPTPPTPPPAAQAQQRKRKRSSMATSPLPRPSLAPPPRKTSVTAHAPGSQKHPPFASAFSPSPLHPRSASTVLPRLHTSTASIATPRLGAKKVQGRQSEASNQQAVRKKKRISSAGDEIDAIFGS